MKRARMMEASTPTQCPSDAGEITLDSAHPLPEAGVEDLSTGTLVGRYLIIGRIGAGAMGVVFAAYDPELDRKIALKLLHTRGGATLDARARLLREAKSLARLSHPNVVAVHDVGTYNDHIFLAMEFVAGRTLTAWLKEQARDWPEVVEVLSRAGEGLAAAHDAGLVHRDFKPDNVLIGDDGRVRVLDFGLARASDSPESAAATSDALAVLASASISASRSREAEAEQLLMTRTGALVGTPAYMSPEQHGGRPADPLSDQFSFCVTLYQALYGVRPFAGTRLQALAYQILQGKVEPPPPGTRVPTWLRKVVVRGLAIAPDQRHPSMRALLAALHRDPRSARPGWSMAGLGGLGLGFGLWMAAAPAAEPPCQGAAGKLEGIWDEARVGAIEHAFHASSAPFAAATWTSTRAALDAYVEAWKQAHHEACAATHIRHEQSEQTLDLRMRCLDRRLSRLEALSESLLRPTTSAIEHAPEAIATLGDIADCDDAEHLSAVVPPPPDRDAVAAIEAQIAAANAHDLAAELQAAHELSARAVDAAASLAYPPLEAEALLVRARVQQHHGKHDLAADALRGAIAAAARGRDDRLVATAWVDFASHVGAFQPDAARLPDLQLAAEAAIGRAGDDLWLRAQLDMAVATMLQRLGKLDEALTALRRALAVFEREPARDPARMQQAYNLAGLIHREQGDSPAAQEAFERGLAIGVRLYGPLHPGVAALRSNLAHLALDLGEVARADELAREVDRVVKTLPESHGLRASSARLRANVAEARKDLATARVLYEEALAIYHQQPDVDRMHTAEVYNDLAILHARQGDLERARELYREALALFQARFGADSVYVTIVEQNLAEISLSLDDPNAALEIVDRLLAALPDPPPSDAPLPYLLCLRAQALLALGRVDDAREPAERAVKLLDTGEARASDATETAIVQATLARVLAAADVEPERRQTLAFLAKAELKKVADDNSAAHRALAALAELSRPADRRRRSRPPGPR